MTQTSINFDTPAQRHSPTSVAAAEAIEPSAATLRGKVLAYLRDSGGATDEEGMAAIGMGGSTWRPRRCELVVRGLVRDSGQTRLTKSGRKAVVWVAT